MDIIGFENSEQTEIFEIIAAILHLGQISFKQDGNHAKILSHDVIKIAAQVNIYKKLILMLMYECTANE